MSWNPDASKAASFVPQLLEEGYGIVLVAVSTCAKCSRTMIATGKGYDFPAFWKAGRTEQLRRADWREKAFVTNADGGALCKECAETDGAFRCELCKQVRQGEPEDLFGDPAEYLCTPCFETVPAKTWAEAVSRLMDAHQYDFC